MLFRSYPATAFANNGRNIFSGQQGGLNMMRDLPRFVRLIERGQLQRDRLAQELLTVSELESAARRQGYGSLSDVERAVLEPGGSISFIGHTPSAEAVRHGEVLSRLDALAREVAALRATI